MKKLTLLLILPIISLTLSGCGFKKDEAPEQNTEIQATQPVEMPDPNAIILDPLPADDIQAIDNELENISQDVESSLNLDLESDLSDEEIGL